MLTAVPVVEELAAPPIVVIKRVDLLLTPAATYLLQRGQPARRAMPSFYWMLGFHICFRIAVSRMTSLNGSAQVSGKETL